MILQEAEQLIWENIRRPGNPDACLEGTHNEYVISFDPFVAKKDVAFSKNRAALARELESARLDREVGKQRSAPVVNGFEEIDARLATFRQQSEQVQRRLDDSFSLGARLNTQTLDFDLQYLDIFGYEPDRPTNNFGANFVWPSREDLEQLGLRKPLQLKAIRTREWKRGQALSAIQLVFEDGIELPVFECKVAGYTIPLKTTEINGKEIYRVRAKTTEKSEGAIYGLSFDHENGSQTIHNSNRATQEFGKSIPEGYQIVGVYGTLWHKHYIWQFGLVLAKFY